MAFTGLHVAAGYVGPAYGRGHIKDASFLSHLAVSETMATPGTSTISAPADHSAMGPPVFRVQAAADSWVSIGAAPNASTGPRTLCRAGGDYDFFVLPGDKLAWTTA